MNYKDAVDRVHAAYPHGHPEYIVDAIRAAGRAEMEMELTRALAAIETARKDPEAEAYWRDKIAQELEAEAERCWNEFATESRGYAHSYFKQAAAFVRSKPQEGG